MKSKKWKTKRFVRETGTDEKTAREFLRASNWEYGKAKAAYTLFNDPDFMEMLRGITDAMTHVIEELTKGITAVADELCKALNGGNFSECSEDETVEERRRDE